MSKFAVYLDALIKQRGESISKISKGSGVERTSIHKALKDERTLSYTSLKQLIQYMQLTLSESRELHQYYEMLMQGEDIFEVQSAILELLSDLSQLNFLSYQNVTFPDISFEANNIPELIHGKPQIEAFVQTVFQAETQDDSAEILLYTPPKSNLTDSLLQFWKTGRNFKANQIISFLPNHHSNGTNPENLHLLKKILPLSILSRSNYFAYYYFEGNTNTSDISPLPYFIITPHYLLTFDKKLTVMQVQPSETLINLYKKRFNRVIKECSALTSYANDLISVIESYDTNTDKDRFYTLMTQPCFGHYYTTERIDDCIIEEVPNREAVVKMCDDHFSRLRNIDIDYYTVFTEEGLRAFADNGVIVDVPPELVIPFDVPGRIALLKELRRDIESGLIKGCIAENDEMTIPNYLTFICDPIFGLHIFAVQDYVSGAYTCNIHISEKSIGESFCDFIKSLPNSRFTYSKEKTLAVFDELIEELENK